MSDLTLHAARSLLALPDDPKIDECLRDYLENHYRAKNTLTSYAQAWKGFARWYGLQAHTREIVELYLAGKPAPFGELVAKYVASLDIAGKSPRTIDQACSAISFKIRMLGKPWDHYPAELRMVLGSMHRKRKGTKANKKLALTDDLLALCLLKCASVRDRAIILTGWWGAFRRSEIVSLNADDVRAVAQGMIVELRFSKTDQTGKGHSKPLHYSSNHELCPVRALRAWMESGQIVEGPLFRPFSSEQKPLERRLSGQEVNNIVKKYVKLAGMDEKLFGAHSLRAGFVTTAAQKGRAIPAIMDQTGHRSVSTVVGYIRNADIFNAAGKDLLDK